MVSPAAYNPHRLPVWSIPLHSLKIEMHIKLLIWFIGFWERSPQVSYCYTFDKVSLEIQSIFAFSSVQSLSFVRLFVTPSIFAFSSVQSLSFVRLFVTPWTAAHQAFLSITNSQSLLKLMSIKSVKPSNHFHPLSSPSPLAFNLSPHQGLF